MTRYIIAYILQVVGIFCVSAGALLVILSAVDDRKSLDRGCGLVFVGALCLLASLFVV